MTKFETMMIIPDSHATPGISNERYTLAGLYAVSMRPDIILCLGDWAHMGSLSEFDKGTKKAHGQSYEADIAVAIDAQEKFFAPIHRFNKAELRAGRPAYKPRLIMLLGNHEYRIDRAANKNPEMFGWITTKDLKFEEFGWEVIPFSKIFNYKDILFTHYFRDGIMDKSVGGVNAARRLTMMDGRTRIMGHSHALQVCWNGKGRKRFGLVAGRWFTHEEDYLSEEAQEDWFTCLTLLTRIKGDGTCHPYFIPYDEIEDCFKHLLPEYD